MLNSKAPRFTADSSQGPIKLTDYSGKWLILFSYPSNFTPVSTTEVVSLCKYHDEFKKRNCELVGVSQDSVASHLAWMKDIEQSTSQIVDFPLVSDTNKTICTLYNMIPRDNTEPVRNVYFIDPEQNIRCILIYPSENGRNTAELLRILDAIQTTNIEGVNTPANWMPNLQTIEPSPRNYIELMDDMQKRNSRTYMDWYVK